MTAPTTHEAATEALMVLSRTMTAVVARTLGEVEGVTVPQLRALVLLGTRGPMNLRVLAENMGVNASNASRTCEKLVSAGLLRRALPRHDRRNVLLTLTDEGESLIRSLEQTRREVLAAVAAQMSAEEQELAVRALEAVDRAMRSSPGLEVVGAPDGRLIPWVL